MGPVSAFGFSVWGWARFGALGWRGRGGGRRRHPGQCAGAGALGSSSAHAVTSAGGPSQAGSMAGMGDPTYTTYLSIHKAWQWQWHGQHGRKAAAGW